jgi:hypothetical protein
MQQDIPERKCGSSGKIAVNQQYEPSEILVLLEFSFQT